MESDTTNELTARQHKVALALATGKSARRVAQECQVSEDTITKWKRLPAFIAARDAAASELRADYFRSHAALAPAVIAARARGLSETQPIAIQIRASDSVDRTIQAAHQFAELAELKAKLTQLEALVAQDLEQARQFAEASIERGEARRIDYRFELENEQR